MAVPRSPAPPQTPPQKETPAGGRKVVRELFGLSLLFWGLFVLLTLISHSQSDPGINHVVSATVPIRNSGGMFGAYISGLLVDLFGFAAFVWPLVFLAWGAGCVSTWFTMPWWRWFGFFILGACLVSLGAAMNFGVGDVRGGGMLGTSLYAWGRFNLSPAGAGLAWLFMLFISLELAFSISWMALINRGYGFAKEKAEANDITLARISGAIGDTLKRYAPHRKAEEPVISLLEINTDAPGEAPAPLSYADVSGAELAAREAAREAALRAAEQAAREAAMRAAEEAARTVLAQSVIFDAPSPTPGQPEARQPGADPLFSAPHSQAAAAELVERRRQQALAEDPVNLALLRMESAGQTAGQTMPPLAAPPVVPTVAPTVAPEPMAAPAASIPDGYLGQARPVNLHKGGGADPAGKAGKTQKSQPADGGLLQTLKGGLHDGLKGGLFGGVLGLFRSTPPPAAPLPEPAGSEPVISLHSILPEPEPELVRPVPVAMPSPTSAQPMPVPLQPVPPVASAAPQPAKPVGSSVLPQPPEPVVPAAHLEPAISAPHPEPVVPAPRPEPAISAQPPAPPQRPAPVLAPAPTLPEPTPEGPQPQEPAARPVAFPPPWAEAAASPKLPPLSMLQTAVASDRLPDMEPMVEKGEQLMACLSNFGIRAELVRITPGPVVTMFEIRPAPGTKVARILNLNQDLALALKALAVRIHPIPGEDTLGVEIPNEQRATVNFRKILESPAFQNAESLLTLALGADIGGSPVVADLAKMPHLLVGGATGAGKSVCINTLLLSMLCKATPDELKLLMVDPKVVELAMYADLPHLIHPVVTETQLAKNALEWAVHEMEQRYIKLARAVVRNIAGYNQKIAAGNLPPDLADLEPMPYLVIVVDELSDLMLSAGKDVETAIVRLAQLARACGIHLIIATQRPSVDVVTGLIKANFPSRIAFQVTSAHDSRTILDTVGAELLLGKGDMLFKPSGSKPRRLHGPFVSDDDVQAVVDYWKSQRAPEYALDFSEWGAPSAEALKNGDTTGMSEEDALYGEIVQFALEEGKKLSISKLQRRFRIGFNKAARFMERMEQDGIIQPAGHANRSRDVM